MSGEAFGLALIIPRRAKDPKSKPKEQSSKAQDQGSHCNNLRYLGYTRFARPAGSSGTQS